MRKANGTKEANATKADEGGDGRSEKKASVHSWFAASGIV